MAKTYRPDTVTGNLFGNESELRFDANKGPRAFNRQSGRRAIFKAITAAHRFTAIVETGTSYGITTRYMARRTGLPVHTIEVAEDRFEEAAKHLSALENVHQHLGNSSDVLDRLLADGTIPSGDLFVYLDAHWQDHLPLVDELTALFDRATGFVAMIDDFRVPDDSGYGFDDYGEAGILQPALLAPIKNRVAGAFYPAMPSHRETGWRRGCIVLTDSAELAGKLGDLAELRPAAL